MTGAELPERGWVTRHSSVDLTGKPALFLDRDGTVIENVPYLSDPAGIVLVPGARDAIAAFKAAGYAVIIVTNQSGIARGLLSPAQYRSVEAAVMNSLGAELIDATYVCPFYPAHPWRKPAPGMLLAAAQDHSLSMAGSMMVGDTLADMIAGAAAGVGALVLVGTGHGSDEREKIEAWNSERTDGCQAPLALIDSIADLPLATSTTKQNSGRS